MPVTLAPIAAGPIRLYRDPALFSQISGLTWTSPLRERLERPDFRRRNFIADGTFELEWEQLVVKPVESIGSSVALADDETWASRGRKSLRVTPSVTGNPKITAESTTLRGVHPGNKVAAGITILNRSDESRRFRLDVVAGDVTLAGEEVLIAASASARLKHVGARVPAPPDPVTTPLGFAYVPEINFELVCLDDHDAGDEFNLDELLLGYSPDGEFVPYQVYPSPKVARGRSVKLWVANEGPTTLSNIRFRGYLCGPDHSRIWLEVTSNPDIMGWVSAFNAPVVVHASTLTPGGTTTCWVRPVVGDDAFEGDHLLAIVVEADN